MQSILLTNKGGTDITEQEIALDLAKVKQQTMDNTKEIDELKRRQDDMDDLVKSVAIIANEQEHMRDDVKEIKSDVKALTDKPGKRWDDLVGKILAAIAGAFLVWVASGMPGLN